MLWVNCVWSFALPVYVPCPAKFDIFTGAQSFIEFACMLLDMADVVELRFQFIERKAVETRFCFEVSHGDAFGNLLLDESQIFEDFLFRKFVAADRLVMFFPGDKFLPGGLQIQMCIVE